MGPLSIAGIREFGSAQCQYLFLTALFILENLRDVTQSGLATYFPSHLIATVGIGGYKMMYAKLLHFAIMSICMIGLSLIGCLMTKYSFFRCSTLSVLFMLVIYNVGVYVNRRTDSASLAFVIKALLSCVFGALFANLVFYQKTMIFGLAFYALLLFLSNEIAIWTSGHSYKVADQTNSDDRT